MGEKLGLVMAGKRLMQGTWDEHVIFFDEDFQPV
jgi:hypothetical protein